MSAGFRRCQTSMTARSGHFRSGNDPSGAAQASRNASTNGAIRVEGRQDLRGPVLGQHEHRPADTLTSEFDEFRLVGRRTEQADLDRRRIPSDRLAGGLDLGPLPERVTRRRSASSRRRTRRCRQRSSGRHRHRARSAGAAAAPASATPSSARSSRARPSNSPRPRSRAPSWRGCSRAGSPGARRRRCRGGPSPPCSSRSRRRKEPAARQRSTVATSLAM